MLTTVIIILREVLEASLLISVLLALQLRLPVYRYWLAWALCLGSAGACLYASMLATISQWADGTGQELVNGLSLLLISLCLGGQLLGMTHPERSRRWSILATAIIILAITREGAEIIVYFSTAQIHPEKTASMVVGGIIGAGLGICLGILCFVILNQLARRNLLFATGSFLVLVTAGLMAEATQSAIQAGLLITDEPLWDSSGWLPESSIMGQLLYAVLSYESSPTIEEVMVWLATAGALTATFIHQYRHFHSQATT